MALEVTRVDALIRSHHPAEVRQEHPEDHQVHEDGGRRQVLQSREGLEAGARLRHRGSLYVLASR